MTSPDSFTQCFQWHPAVHDAWGHEDLWFCFFGFQVYDRARVVEKLPRALEKLGVRSYVLYELSGQYDVLVRVWVPRSISRFEKKMEDLEKELGGAVETIKVDEVVHHWVWEESERSKVGLIKAPEATMLAGGKPLRELDLLNRVQGALADGAELEGEFTEEEREELDALLRTYQADRIISHPPYEPGIKFVVQVKVQQNRNQGDALADTLCKVLTKAYGTIWDRSLYRSRSSYIQFIVFGRVRLRPELSDDGNESHPFHAITPTLLDEISQAASLSGRRTYTFFLPQQSFLAYRDEISLPPPPDEHEPNALELFRKREGHYFEAKGSVWTELGAWLREEADEPSTSKDLGHGALHNLVWAIVALLNSDGGTILLGALEESKYGKHPRFKSLPVEGHYRCCGIDFDLAGQDWDDFIRGLWGLLCARIDPAPSARWIKLWEQKVHKRTVGMITIALPDDWYYVVVNKTERRFVVRDNAQTKLLQGPEVEKYQATHHRANRTHANDRQNR